jgi:hypothetical protein
MGDRGPTRWRAGSEFPRITIVSACFDQERFTGVGGPAVRIKLNAPGVIDWSRAAFDGSHVCALLAGLLTGPSPVGRARTGSKHICSSTQRGSRSRLPWPAATATTSPSLRRSWTIFALPRLPEQAQTAAPKARPGSCRSWLRLRHAPPPAAGRGHQTRDRAPRQPARLRPRPPRLVVERGFASLHNFRRLRMRHERSPALHPRYSSSPAQCFAGDVSTHYESSCKSV